MNDPEAAWCASTRGNFWLRAVRPELTEASVDRHDVNVGNCLRTIFGTPRAATSSQMLSTLFGTVWPRIGLASAHRVRVAAH